PRPVRAAGTARQSGQRRYDSGWRDFADREVVFIRHVDIARAVHRHAGRTIKPRATSRTVHAARNGGISGEGGEAIRLIGRLGEALDGYQPQRYYYPARAAG